MVLVGDPKQLSPIAPTRGVAPRSVERWGRRSGLVRTMPLAYLPDPDDPSTCVIVASNGGSAKPPAWWLNVGMSPMWL